MESDWVHLDEQNTVQKPPFLLQGTNFLVLTGVHLPLLSSVPWSRAEKRSMSSEKPIAPNGVLGSEGRGWGCEGRKKKTNQQQNLYDLLMFGLNL